VILTMTEAKAWLGDRLKRRGPVSEATFAILRAQGLPIGMIGGRPYLSTEAVEPWLEWMAGLGMTASTPISATERRKPGRPRKRP
jgi:hypothetical protein